MGIPDWAGLLWLGGVDAGVIHSLHEEFQPCFVYSCNSAVMGNYQTGPLTQLVCLAELWDHVWPVLRRPHVPRALPPRSNRHVVSVLQLWRSQDMTADCKHVRRHTNTTWYLFSSAKFSTKMKLCTHFERLLGSRVVTRRQETHGTETFFADVSFCVFWLRGCEPNHSVRLPRAEP